MQNVSDNLTKLNDLSQLLVVRGEPNSLLPELWKRWGITHLAFERDPNGYARARDAVVREAAKKAGVEIIERDGHHLYDIQEVINKNKGKPIMTMASYRKVRKILGECDVEG